MLKFCLIVAVAGVSLLAASPLNAQKSKYSAKDFSKYVKFMVKNAKEVEKLKADRKAEERRLFKEQTAASQKAGMLKRDSQEFKELDARAKELMQKFRDHRKETNSMNFGEKYETEFNKKFKDVVSDAVYFVVERNAEIGSSKFRLTSHNTPIAGRTFTLGYANDKRKRVRLELQFDSPEFKKTENEKLNGEFPVAADDQPGTLRFRVNKAEVKLQMEGGSRQQLEDLVKLVRIENLKKLKY